MVYKLNLDQTKVIFELFELVQTKSLPFPDFKQKLNAEINKLRVSFNKQTVDGDSTCRLLSVIVMLKLISQQAVDLLPVV